MKNLNVKGKFVALALAGTMVLSLAGCGVDYSRKVIKENNISSSTSEITFNYDNGNENLDYSRTNVKTFDVGEHVLLVKVAGTIGYDSPIQVESKDGYEIADVTYGENATGEYGHSYGYFTFMYKNTEPVKAVGYYDNNKGDYAYIEFGKVIEQEKVNTK